MKSSKLFLLVLLTALPTFAQHLVPAPVFNAIATEFSGENAQENDRQIVQYHRIQGSPMMAEVAEKVVLAKLRSWGIESKLEQFPSDGKTLYQTYISPMGWDMRGGELWVESVAGDKNFQPYRLCRYSDAPMCVSTYSKGGDATGELVEVGAGTKESDYVGKDLHGKVALASGYAGDVVRKAVLEHGAIGVVIYPTADDRPEHPDMVRYNGIWPRAEELDKTAGGFQISLNQYSKLQELMRRGAVRVHGKIDATLGPGRLTLVHAWVRGTKFPEKEILITGHLDHPKWSANDNASGSAAMLEMVRALNALVAAHKLPPPQATLHFMWVPEYFGSVAYVTQHPEARGCGPWDDPRQPKKPYVAGDPCIVLNLNLDMVGEDTVKTNSRFYITRTPDSVPGDLNGLMSDVMEQTREAYLFAPTGTHNYWPAEMAPYAQGSDHDIFLGLGIPSAMIGHDPDWTHHTSEDTVDKTDASEFLRTGVLAAAAAWWAASPRGENAFLANSFSASEILRNYSKRIAQIIPYPGLGAPREPLGFDMKVVQTLAEHLVASPNPLAIYDADHPSKSGPRRLTIPPIYAPTFASLAGEDKKWRDEQEAVFASDSPGGGLPVKPTFPVIVFEAMNFMDGKRDAAAIAGLLSSEYNHDFDAAWVERLVGVLAKLQLVAPR